MREVLNLRKPSLPASLLPPLPIRPPSSLVHSLMHSFTHQLKEGIAKWSHWTADLRTKSQLQFDSRVSCVCTLCQTYIDCFNARLLYIQCVKNGHYSDVMMGAMASQITSVSIVFSTVYSGGDQRKHQSSASLAVVWGIHRWPVNSLHKWPVTRKIFPFDDVIMRYFILAWSHRYVK